MNNSVKFLTDYVQENINAVEDAQTYIKDRGFLDGFGMERLATAGAKQEFAHLIDHVLKSDAEAEEAERLEYIKAYFLRKLTDTTLFGSTSLGANMLTLAEVEQAQYLTRRIEWWEAVDAS